MQACDPALAVVAGQTRIWRVFRACDATATRAADGRSDELPAREAVTVSLDDAQRLVPEHQQSLVPGWDPEEPFRDLAVGAADADLQRADEHLALACFCAWNLFDACRVRTTRLRDERLQARPP